jgi:hypothetical protein
MHDHGRCVVSLCALAALSAAACKGDSDSGAQAAPPTPAPTSQTTTAAITAAEAPQSGPLRCGDFLSKAEAAALGLDAEHYKDGETQENPSLGVGCSLGHVLAVIYHGTEYSTMQRGKDEAVKRGALQTEEGPTVGNEAHWSTMSGMHTVGFLSTSKQFAGLVTSPDKALAEKVAKALDYNMKKPR